MNVQVRLGRLARVARRTQASASLHPVAGCHPHAVLTKVREQHGHIATLKYHVVALQLRPVRIRYPHVSHAISGAQHITIAGSIDRFAEYRIVCGIRWPPACRSQSPSVDLDQIHSERLSAIGALTLGLWIERQKMAVDEAGRSSACDQIYTRPHRKTEVEHFRLGRRMAALPRFHDQRRRPQTKAAKQYQAYPSAPRLGNPAIGPDGGRQSPDHGEGKKREIDIRRPPWRIHPDGTEQQRCQRRCGCSDLHNETKASPDRVERQPGDE